MVSRWIGAMVMAGGLIASTGVGGGLIGCLDLDARDVGSVGSPLNQVFGLQESAIILDPAGEEVCADYGAASGGGDMPGSHGGAGVVYATSEFVGNAAEAVYPYLPSNYSEIDSRAGSVEINTNGLPCVGDLAEDPAYSAWIMTLRNGYGDKIEQVYAERFESTNKYDDLGCVVLPAYAFPVCAVWSEQRRVNGLECDDCVFLESSAVDGVLGTSVPDRSANSNEGHDDSDQRVTVEASLQSDLTAANGLDNHHQTVRVAWQVPAGRHLLDSTRLIYKGRLDWNCDGLGSNDPFVDLFHIETGTIRVHDPSVAIVNESDTQLEIEVGRRPWRPSRPPMRGSELPSLCRSAPERSFRHKYLACLSYLPSLIL